MRDLVPKRGHVRTHSKAGARLDVPLARGYFRYSPRRAPLQTSLSALGLCRFPLDARGVAPKVLQTIEGPFVAVKDVHHHL
jgi:hypothetical protein